MTHLMHRVSLIILLALLTSTTLIFAQDDDSFTVVGSGIVNPIVEALAEANNTDTLTVTTTGTNAGFQEFCSGSADIVTSTRAITADEDANCITNNITYTEFLLGHSIITFAMNSSTDFIDCLGVTELGTLFAPTSAGQIIDWSNFNPEIESLPLSIIVPQDSTVEYLILDSMVEGDGIRRDVSTDIDSALTVLAEDTGTLAVLPYTDALAQNDEVQLLDVNYATTTGCSAPSAENVENRLYGAAQSLLLYVNRATLDSNDMLKSLIESAINSDVSAIVSDAGFVSASDNALAANVEALETGKTGRLFSEAVAQFEIPIDLTGQINIGGSANLYGLLNGVGSRLTASNQNVVLEFNVEGQTAGIRRLCNGEIDIAMLESTADDEALAGCEANSITTIPFDLGTQATVLVANAADAYASCLTTEQISTIWSSASTDTISNWSDVDSAFPDQEMTLFGLVTPTEYSDILLLSNGVIPPIRLDTEQNTNALYRAAATANVEGALTYMSWQDYQRVLGNNQANIQLVAVDSGTGCTVPSVATIDDGSYPLSRPASILVSQTSLAHIAIQSFLWTLFGDENYSAISAEGLVGTSFGDLPDIRASLETEFSLAQSALSDSSADAKATAEPNSDDSTAPEATTEPDSEETASPEATDEPDSEETASPEATSEATDEADSE